jgi:glutathione S-transferase
LGAVPVLEIDGFTMHESDAICWYLAERFPQANLVPEIGTHERANCLQWFQFASGTLGSASSSRWPLKNLPEYDLETKALVGKSAREVLVGIKKDVDESFKGALAALEDRLKDRPYLCNEFTLADISVAYSLGWQNSQGALEGFPVLQEYLQRNQNRAAAQKAKCFQFKAH